MKWFKGFDKDLQCRGFQYEIGKEYEEKEADLCNSGFRACENPLDVFKFYSPAFNRFCEVDLSGKVEKGGDKFCATKIRIGAEIGLFGICKAAVEYIKENVDWKDSTATNTGDRSAATNTGDYSAASVEGKESVAMAIGYESKARGALGCWIVLSEWGKIDDKHHIIDVKSVKVDGDKIKADTWYILENGEFKQKDE